MLMDFHLLLVRIVTVFEDGDLRAVLRGVTTIFSMSLHAETLPDAPVSLRWKADD